MNHTEALISTLTKPRVAYVKAKTRGSGSCAEKTPCGRKCCCNNYVPHTLHICKRADCEAVTVPSVTGARLGHDDRHPTL